MPRGMEPRARRNGFWGSASELVESRKVRRLRKLAQVVQEEVGKYGLEVGVKVSSSPGPSTSQALAPEVRDERVPT